MDYVIAGITCLWVPNKRGPLYFEEIILDNVLQGENLNSQQLMEVGILATNVQCSTAFTWVRHYGSIENIMKTSLLENRSIDIVQGLNRFIHKPVYSRIRPDHLERVKEFLDGL
jgi:hypothetical protein